MKRFIPTPVGNARALSRPRRRAAVHPHARGERHGFSAGQRKRVGSSPRPWGTRKHYEATPQQVRFIPTPVGNARPTAASSAPAAVHPHARGERLRRFFRATNEGGSSPRPWGTLEGTHRPGDSDRFIPTPVGNAGANSSRSARRSVHPHARGERGVRTLQHLAGRGSSPRPWGTLALARQSLNSRRFIPTPVGNASSTSTSPSDSAVHPHARGERALTIRFSAGSSRFIPTPVGNAVRQHQFTAVFAVHPHARGERQPGMPC